MSSKASTTIGFERRFNPALAHDDVGLFVAESAACRRRGHRTWADRRDEPRPLRRASSRSRPSSRRAATARRSSTCGRSRRSRRATSRGTQRPGFRDALLDQGGIRPRLPAGRDLAPPMKTRSSSRRRALRSVGFLDSRATSSGAGRALELGRGRRTRRAPREGSRADRRPREGRARHGPHRRQPEHPVPAARAGRGRPPADRRSSRSARPARARRSRPASSRATASTPPSRERRHRLLGRVGQADGRISALRLRCAATQAVQPFDRVPGLADRRDQLLAVRLVARRDDELDLGLQRARRPSLRGGGRRRRRCRGPRDEIEDS